jgi:hypothetical protein
MAKRLSVSVRVLPLGRDIDINGRDAWALLQLVEAGERGCTPLDNPGPRWSGYVHNLRHVHGLDIQTVNEAHGGPFAGSHARYVLRTMVQIVWRSDWLEGCAA